MSKKKPVRKPARPRTTAQRKGKPKPGKRRPPPDVAPVELPRVQPTMLTDPDA